MVGNWSITGWRRTVQIRLFQHHLCFLVDRRKTSLGKRQVCQSHNHRSKRVGARLKQSVWQYIEWRRYSWQSRQHTADFIVGHWSEGWQIIADIAARNKPTAGQQLECCRYVVA